MHFAVSSLFGNVESNKFVFFVRIRGLKEGMGPHVPPFVLSGGKNGSSSR